MAAIAETFIVLYAVYNIWVLYDVRGILYTKNIVLTQGRISAISAISVGHKIIKLFAGTKTSYLWDIIFSPTNTILGWEQRCIYGHTLSPVD